MYMWRDNNRIAKDNFTNGKNDTTIYFKTKTRYKWIDEEQETHPNEQNVRR